MTNKIYFKVFILLISCHCIHALPIIPPIFISNILMRSFYTSQIKNKPLFLINDYTLKGNKKVFTNENMVQSFQRRINPNIYPYLAEMNIKVIKSTFPLLGSKDKYVESLSLAYINPKQASNKVLIITHGINGLTNSSRINNRSYSSDVDNFEYIFRYAKKNNQSLLLVDLFGFRIVDAPGLGQLPKELASIYQQTNAIYLLGAHILHLKQNPLYTYSRFKLVTNTFLNIFNKNKPNIKPKINIIGVSFSGVVLQNIIREQYKMEYINSIIFIAPLIIKIPLMNTYKPYTIFYVGANDDVLKDLFIFYRQLGITPEALTLSDELKKYSFKQIEYYLIVSGEPIKDIHSKLCCKIWEEGFLDYLLNLKNKLTVKYHNKDTNAFT